MTAAGLEVVGLENVISAKQAANLYQHISSYRQGSSMGVDRRTSVHEIPDHTPQQAAAVYEPNGRIELVDLPVNLLDRLNELFTEMLPRLRNIFPQATSNNGWFYAEYGPGQYVNAHVDYHGRVGDPRPGVLATLSLTVARAGGGGHFFIEPSADPRAWDAPHEAARGQDFSSPWFREQRRIRWLVDPTPGDVIVWGSQLVHGTTAVTQGATGKFLTQLVTS